MVYTFDEIMKYIEEEDAKFIRLAFRDAFGIQKNISILPGELKKAFDIGAPVNSRMIAGFENCSFPTVYLRPDPSTLAVLPWRPDSGKVLRMFCEVCDPDGNVIETDTREILKKAVVKAEEAGIGFRFGTEAEFYLFLKDNDGEPTRIPYDKAGYMDIAPLDKCENIRREIILTIEKMGLVPERSHHEQGPGQNQIDFHYGRPLKAADQMITFKMAVSTIADRYGLYADFSPMPLEGKPGNGYHINIYAEDKDGNDVVRAASAGIINRIREITLFLNPTEESYSRLGSVAAPGGAEDPGSIRSGLMYIGSFHGHTRSELRSPDAAGNPYLVYALLIYAGLEGIEKGMELSGEADVSGDILPASREEAVRFALDSGFVRSVIPEDIIMKYAEN